VSKIPLPLPQPPTPDGGTTSLREVLTRGGLIVFSLGILAFIVYTLLNILVGWWRPVIESLTGSESAVVVVPLTIVFTAVLVAFVGFAFTWKRLLRLFSKFASRIPVLNWFLGEGRIPQSIHDMPGALVRFSEGTYYIAALVGGQKFQGKNGKIENMYKLYCPSAPVPWSGLPIIFARPEQVIILKLSFGEVYGITTSFGRSTPATLEELSLHDALDTSPEDEEPPGRPRAAAAGGQVPKRKSGMASGGVPADRRNRPRASR